MAKKTKITIVQGKTFSKVFRWAVEPFLYKAISGIALQAPVRITVAGHGLPDGWPVAPVSIVGTKELNATNGGDNFDTDYKRITVIDANMVEINSVNASGYTAYVSGGYLKTPTPMDLSGYSARMTIKDKEGTVLATFTSDDGDFDIDNTDKKISLVISAAASEDYSVTAFKKAVYEIEMYNGSGLVYQIAFGDVVLEKEIAT